VISFYSGPVPAWTINVATAFDVAESPSLPKNLNRSLIAVNRDILRDINVTLTLVPLLVGDENQTRQVTHPHLRTGAPQRRGEHFNRLFHRSVPTLCDLPFDTKYAEPF